MCSDRESQNRIRLSKCPLIILLPCRVTRSLQLEPANNVFIPVIKKYRDLFFLHNFLSKFKMFTRVVYILPYIYYLLTINKALAIMNYVKLSLYSSAFPHISLVAVCERVDLNI